MSLYIIEDRYGALRDSSVNYNYAKSLQQSRYPDGHIVELVPAKPKVQVSQEEADMLEKAKHPTLRPSFMITEYSNSHKGNILGNDLEDRLMRAYVNGYTVEKEKKYLLPMDGTLEENDDNDNFQLYAYCYRGRWLVDEDETDPSYKHHTVTKKELDTAPEWVKAITPVEVADDGTK